jgi:hypothetical protein
LLGAGAGYWQIFLPIKKALQQEPYIPPAGAPGFSATGNPNLGNEKGRGDQISFRGDTVKPFSIGIQDIDEAVFYYFQNVIKPIC